MMLIQCQDNVVEIVGEVRYQSCMDAETMDIV